MYAKESQYYLCTSNLTIHQTKLSQLKDILPLFLPNSCVYFYINQLSILEQRFCLIEGSTWLRIT